MPGASTNYLPSPDILRDHGARRLQGGETGSTCVVKVMAFARWGTADTGPFIIVANDNYAPVRAAA